MVKSSKLSLAPIMIISHHNTVPELVVSVVGFETP